MHERLPLDTPVAHELSDALDLVLAQPASAAKGNHANLCWVMHNIFGRNYTKKEAVVGAIWALWREQDLFDSQDTYVMEFVRERDAQTEHDSYYEEMAQGD